MQKWLNLKAWALVIGVLSVASIGIVFALIEFQRDLPASVTVELRVPDGVEVYLDAELTQTADLLDFGVVELDFFGTPSGDTPVPLWVANLSNSSISLRVVDDLLIGEVLIGFGGAELRPSPEHTIILEPGQVVDGRVGLRFSETVAGPHQFTVSFVADGPIAVPTPTPTATPTPTPTPTATPSPPAGDLRIAFTVPVHETHLFWRGAARPVNLQVRPFADPLLATDQSTGEIVPGIASSWELNAAGDQWTFNLRDDIPFHFGWGNLSSTDVPHSLSFVIREDSLASDAGLWRELIGETTADIAANVQIPDANTVIFNLSRANLGMESVAANIDGSLYIHSKDQWDAEGMIGYEAMPAATGSWQFVEQQLGQFISYEATTNHWRKTPGFETLRLFWVSEAAARLAMLLTDEVDISELDRSLYAPATSRGMEIVGSTRPAMFVHFWFGGIYSPDGPNYDPTVPYLDVRVREAVNRAVNREEFMEVLFGTRGEVAAVEIAHSTITGWDPRYTDTFEENYGYDPERARQLLAEAGYPDGFNTEVVLTQLSGAPEMTDGAEVMVGYLQEIGINATLREIEFSQLRQDFRDKVLHNMIIPQNAPPLPPAVTIRVLNYSGDSGIVHTFNHPEIDTKFETLSASVDSDEIERLIREINDIKFDEYATIPLAWLPFQLVVNPNVIGEYVFPGNISGNFTHTEYIVPAQ